jgi:hypothetical protein
MYRTLIVAILSLNMLASNNQQAQNMILNTYFSVIYVRHKVVAEVDPWLDHVGSVATKWN